MKRVLRAIEAAREDGLTIDVSGLDEFDIGDFSGELDDAKKLLGLGIGSKTLKQAGLEEAGAQVPVRRAAGDEGPDRRRDRRVVRAVIEAKETKDGARTQSRRGDAGGEGTDIRGVIREAIEEYARKEAPRPSRRTRPSWWRSGSGGSNWSAG